MTYVDTYSYDKPSVLIPRKGSIDKLYYVEEPFWTVDTIFYTIIDTSIVLPKYVYYCLAKEHLEKLNKAGGVPSLTQTVINKVEIPVPPLPVQKEIVRILDMFTGLTAELTAELTARKKQYEYYRDKIFNNVENNAPSKKLGDLITFLNGRAYKQEELLSNGKYKVVRVGNFFSNNSWYYSNLELESEKYCNKGDLLYTWAASLGAFIWNDEKAIYHYHVWKLDFDETKIDKEYLLHFFNYDVNNIQKSLTESTMPHISMANMKKRTIPVPAMEKQKEIAKKMNQLSDLCTSISTGLPAEIEARQKQYEYYRDKLLTFKRKA